MTAQEDIQVGSVVDIYWPRDARTYAATIKKISDTEVEVEYDDGLTKTYPLSAVLVSERVLSVCDLAWKCVCLASATCSYKRTRTYNSAGIVHALFLQCIALLRPYCTLC